LRRRLSGGGTAIGWATTHQDHAPQPTAAVAGTLDPPDAPSVDASREIGSATQSARATEPRPLQLPPSHPERLRIPAIELDSTLQALGLNPDGTLQVPAPGPFYNEAAWFDHSPTPGELGPSVVEGHIDSAKEGPSVFLRLGAVRPGEQVLVTRADSSTAVFTINAVRRYPKDNFAIETVYGDTGRGAALRLITCGGTFDRVTRNYRDHIVVFADLTATTAP